MTTAEKKARLRAYGLPVTGTAAQVADRMAYLDDVRAMYRCSRCGPSGELIELSRDELKAMLDRLGVKTWKLGTKARLLMAARRIVEQSEPLPAAPAKAAIYTVVWRNPATGKIEAETQGLTRAAADRRAKWVERDTTQRIAEVSHYLPEDRAAEAFVTVTHGQSAYPVGHRRSQADTDIMEAWYELSRVNESAMGPALSANAPRLREIVAQGERLAEKVRALRSRARENPARPRAVLRSRQHTRRARR